MKTSCNNYKYTFILTAIISPFIINELYKTNKGYLVLWEAKDMLIYVSSIISVLATIFESVRKVCKKNPSMIEYK